jgi:prepilin-type N-terminal cleavage/methylation domain-containing protein
MNGFILQRNTRQRGFTLIEIAIALLVVSILLGYSLALLPVQQDLKKSRRADREIDLIIEQLVAHAQVNGRLPCPDTDLGAPDGFENTDPDPTVGCDGFFGFLPGRTLGMNGNYSNEGQLLDPWGTAYGYAVSDVESGDGNIDLVVANGVRVEGLSNVTADLFICDDGAAPLANDLNCTAAGSNDVMPNVAAVVISLGKDVGTIASTIQVENTDNFGPGPLVDKVYVFSTRSDVPGAEFDDVVKWLSTNQLFSKMIEAGQLP